MRRAVLAALLLVVLFGSGCVKKKAAAEVVAEKNQRTLAVAEQIRSSLNGPKERIDEIEAKMRNKAAIPVVAEPDPVRLQREIEEREKLRRRITALTPPPQPPAPAAPPAASTAPPPPAAAAPAQGAPDAAA